MVDWDRLRNLAEEIGEGDCAEVVDLFFAESGDAIGRLALPGTMPERDADLHFIKGSARSLGFDTLGALCEGGERRAALGTLDEVWLKAVIDAYDATRAAFEAGRGKA